MSKRILHQFLSTYSSESTKKLYHWAITKFISHHIDDFVDLDADVDRYFSEYSRVSEHKANLLSFFASEISGNPSKTQKTIYGCLRAMFNFVHDPLELLDKPINPQFWKDLRKRNTGLSGKTALTLDRIPTNEECAAPSLDRVEPGQSSLVELQLTLLDLSVQSAQWLLLLSPD